MPQNRPHIILIMTDQQRWDTIGAWGCDYMVTPNMDRLAEGGVFSPGLLPGGDLYRFACGDLYGDVPAYDRGL